MVGTKAFFPILGFGMKKQEGSIIHSMIDGLHHTALDGCEFTQAYAIIIGKKEGD